MLLIGFVTIRGLIVKRNNNSQTSNIEELQNVQFLEEEQLLVIQTPREDLFPNCRLKLEVTCYYEEDTEKNILVPDTPPFNWETRYEIFIDYSNIVDCRVKYLVYSDTDQIAESLISYKERKTYEN